MPFYSANAAASAFDQATLAERTFAMPGAVCSKPVTFTGSNDAGALSASAALTTALTGANNDLVITAATAGVAGNNITIAYVNPGTSAATISVTVNGTAITVNLATSTAANASGTLTSDATNITAADTVTVGAQVYTFKTALTEVKASGTLTSDNTNVANGETVTIGDLTYTFVTALTVGGHNQVVIGVDADTSLTNLAAAINGSAGAGTTYSTGVVANPKATSGAVSSHTLTITAAAVGVAGNAYPTTETSAHLSFGAATLASGVDPVANEIFRGVDADTSLGNLVAAINGAAGAGTKYSSNTAVSTVVTAAAVAAHATVLTAISAVAATGNAVATTETSSHLSFGAATLANGVDPGTISSTAANISTAISGYGPAAALVGTANAGGNDGTGKVTALAATALTGGSDGYVPLFTVTGDIMATVVGVSQVTPTGASATLAIGVTGATGLFTAAQTATSISAHKTLDKTGIVAQTGTPATVPIIAVSSQNIIGTVAAAAIATGAINFYCIWYPLTPGATVTAS